MELGITSDTPMDDQITGCFQMIELFSSGVFIIITIITESEGRQHNTLRRMDSISSKMA